jgi:hypothetical protein
VKKKSKSSTTSNQQTTMTSTPTNPEWSTNLVSGLAGKIGSTFDKLDPASLVAGADPLQQQAAAGAAGLSTSPNYGLASEMYGQAGNAGAQDIAGGMSAFYNPFEDRVVETSLADFDHGAGQQTAQANLDLAGDTTFGGSSGALYKSALGGELARGRGALSAGIRSDGFRTALGGATSQAQMNEQALVRQMQGASGLAGVAGMQGADARANIDQQSQMGEILRQIEAQKRLAPVTALGMQGSLTSGLPLNMFTGQNASGTMTGNSTSKTTESGATLADWMKMAGQAAGAAAMASDFHLKTDIETERYDDKGRRWVSWRWKWDEPDAERKHGVIAQEVRETDPDAVMMHPMGFLMVDYSKLGDA